MFYKRKGEKEDVTEQTESISNREDEYLAINEFDKEKFNTSYDISNSLKSKVSSFIEDFKKENKDKKFTKYNFNSELDKYLFDKMAICPKCQFHKYVQMVDNDINLTDKTILINVNKYNYCVGGISDYPVRCSSKTIECNSFKLKEETAK